MDQGVGLPWWGGYPGSVTTHRAEYARVPIVARDKLAFVHFGDGG